MTANTCKHLGKFFCTTVTVPEGTTHAFACLHHCGFWLNFDPSYAGHVRDKPAEKDSKNDFWKLTTIAFYPHPNPNQSWKTPQPMAVEGSKMRKDEFK